VARRLVGVDLVAEHEQQVGQAALPRLQGQRESVQRVDADAVRVLLRQERPRPVVRPIGAAGAEDQVEVVVRRDRAQPRCRSGVTCTWPHPTAVEADVVRDVGAGLEPLDDDVAVVVPLDLERSGRAAVHLDLGRGRRLDPDARCGGIGVAQHRAEQQLGAGHGHCGILPGGGRGSQRALR
jgi:hypothetical protein